MHNRHALFVAQANPPPRQANDQKNDAFENG
jgi:hypothetical protein